jgi:drug/metabolite transporter (DMT)-like permease
MRPMNSMWVFGSYMMALGVCLASAPNLATGLLALPETHEPWPRILGALLVVFGAYYVTAYRERLVAFARVTVPGRLALAAFCILLVLLRQVKWTLLLAIAVDIAGALWTALELRKQKTGSGPAHL